jgi:hypothetical protein
MWNEAPYDYSVELSPINGLFNLVTLNRYNLVVLKAFGYLDISGDIFNEEPWQRVQRTKLPVQIDKKTKRWYNVGYRIVPKVK